MTRQNTASQGGRIWQIFSRCKMCWRPCFFHAVCITRDGRRRSLETNKPELNDKHFFLCEGHQINMKYKLIRWATDILATALCGDYRVGDRGLLIQIPCFSSVTGTEAMTQLKYFNLASLNTQSLLLSLSLQIWTFLPNWIAVGAVLWMFVRTVNSTVMMWTWSYI